MLSIDTVGVSNSVYSKNGPRWLDLLLKLLLLEALERALVLGEPCQSASAYGPFHSVFLAATGGVVEGGSAREDLLRQLRVVPIAV